MEQSEILIRILLTVIFGAILGLETETRQIADKGKKKAENEEKSRLGGLRTYTVLSLLGGISGLLFNAEEYNLAYITFIGVIALVVSAYIQNIQIKQAFGLTTEIAILVTYLLGFLTTSALVELPTNLVILVLLTFFLSQKRGFGKFIEKVSHAELNDLAKFGLISLVALPLLPNQTYYIEDLLKALEISTSNIDGDILEISLLNPSRMWLIVVVISGINLGGYLLKKFIGQKSSLIVSSVLGGLVSSTSTTVALAARAKENKQNTSQYVGAALIANAVSFITFASLITILSIDLFKKIYISLALFFVIGIITGLFFILRSKTKAKNHLDIKYEPFTIAPAIKFVGLIIIITILIQLLALTDNETIVSLGTAISGVTGMDAPIVAITETLKNNEISVNLAATIFLLTNTINFLAKIGYGYYSGNKDFARKLALGLGITALGSIGVLIT